MTDNEIADVFQPRQIGPCLMVEGFGAKLHVQRGHLVVDDGFGPHRRTVKLPRIERTVRRIMWVALDGYVTVDAARWMSEVGMSFVMVDTAGDVLMVNGKAPNESRLRRRQALGSVAAAKFLITEKMRGQYEICGDSRIKDRLLELYGAETLHQIRDLEAKAAYLYWKSYKGMPIKFKDAVPDHWRSFDRRASVLSKSDAPRYAANPINALLNLAYTIASAEARLVCHAMGLDPGMGVLHQDRSASYAMALDLLEIARPTVDQMIFNLLRERVFTAKDFTETIKGQCLVMPPLDREIIQHTQEVVKEPLARAVEDVAHILASESRTKVNKRTPLTRRNAKAPHAKTGNLSDC
ncbi:CRISPR-associated endonuclease Cas1 [Streptomyces olivoreticuli]